MRLFRPLLAFAALMPVPAGAAASATWDIAKGYESSAGRNRQGNDANEELPPYLQCVPYARELTGVQIYGDALTWWGQAAGRYARGHQPQVGAVMAFQPHRNMTLGHVAAVSKIIDRRTVLISHSNWSPIDGRRGQIERNVRAVDVSPDNDWSEVRVWYHPLQALGNSTWPVYGFIYGSKADAASQLSRPRMTLAPVNAGPPADAGPSRQFSQAFASLSAPVKPAWIRTAASRPALREQHPAPRQADAIRNAIALYE